MSHFDLRLLVAWGFFLAFIIIAVYIVIVKKLRNIVKKDELREVPDFMLENIRGSLAQKKQISEELERREQLNAAILQQIDIGIAILDPYKVLKSANPRFLELFGLPPNAVGSSIVQWQTDAPRLFLFLRDLRSASAAATASIDAVIMNRTIRIRSVPMNGTKDGTGGYLVISEDVTEIESAKQELELRKRMEILGEMSAGLAHEFRNGLSTLMGYAQLILGSAGNGSETENHAEHILSEVRTMNQLVDRFLLFAKPLDVTRQWLTGEDFAADVRTIADRVQHPVEIEIQPGLRIETDRVLLQNCLDNLIRNSVQHFARKEEGHLRISLTQRTGGIEITLVDNGPGMDPETLARACIPFFTTRTDGTGLGLAICEKIINRLGGSFRIASAPGAGTTVTITL